MGKTQEKQLTPWNGTNHYLKEQISSQRHEKMLQGKSMVNKGKVVNTDIGL